MLWTNILFVADIMDCFLKGYSMAFFGCNDYEYVMCTQI